MAAIVLLYAWTVIRDLRDLSGRLADLESAPVPAESPSFEPPGVSAVELALATQSWFGAPSADQAITREVVISETPPPPVEAPPVEAPPPVQEEPVQIQFASQPLPSIQLTGIVLGARVREVVVTVDGQKQQMGVGAELNGWRLVEIDRASAAFESPSGERQSVHLFPNVP